MRLSLKSLKLFVVLTTLAGSLFAFSPGASAHKNTGSFGPVAGTVTWPQDPKEGTVRDGAGFDLDRGVGSANLSLDRRAGTNSLLNGCRLAGGNSGEGLPVGNTGKVTDSGTPPAPRDPELYTTHDLCFRFDGLQIESAGLWDGLNHKTNFSCVASGTTGASGNDKAGPPSSGLPGPTFGSFYGEFTCNGLPLEPTFDWVPSADGHFHGLTLGSTTIGFLGEVHCTVAGPAPVNKPCPKNNLNNATRLENDGHTTPLSPNGSPLAVGENHNDSRIKHTLACKGEVVPLLQPTPGAPPPIYKWTDYDGDGVDDSGNPVTAALGDSIGAAQVVLECTIA